ncbi:MAG: hypothetical protein ACI8RZ_007381 [Myxococcota bacterium]|jgi:hypothetical protein
MSSLLLLLGSAGAQDYRAPFGDADYGYFYPTAYYDHSGYDWACGSIRYSGHRGSDFGGGSWSGMDAGRDIVAAAPGVVYTTNDGEFDECSSGDCSGGGGYGNYVVIVHGDGKFTYYAHLKTWSLTVSSGQSVSCGQKLGEMGSSGYSTGPHLHFESRTSGGSQVDPFDGTCSSPPSYWVSQGSYGALPGTTCETTDSDGDGYDDDDDCDDGNASIHPGASEICDDGVDNNCDGAESESSSGYLDYDGDGYGDEAITDCDGLPDNAVTTGGDCDDGSTVIYPGAVELCDGLDNNCDGLTDDDSPATLGTTLPGIAAILVDHSIPSTLAPGQRAEVWLVVENVGTETWPRRSMWLEAADATEPSPLLDESSWAAYNVLAVLDEEVAPGGTGAFVGTIRATTEPVSLTETLTLTASGEPVRCPIQSITVSLSGHDSSGSPPEEEPLLTDGGGCAHAPVGGGFLSLLLLLGRRRCS